MTRLSSVCLISVALSLASATLTATEEEVRVMTRNMYVGGDLEPILDASTPAAFVRAVIEVVAQIAASDFPQRGETLARELVEKRPHLVGLQEVFRFTINGTTGPPPFRDHLEDLLSELRARGAEYYVAAQVENLKIALTIPELGVLEASDRDVILVRAGVPASPLPVTGCRTSLDGCNFRVTATAGPVTRPIRIERGYVIVDAVVGSAPVRFVNTHLEIPELGPQVQAAQASELIATLSRLPLLPDAPTILVGDINSAPEDQTVWPGGVPVVPPYWQFADAGLADVWLLRPGTPPGFTCCHEVDLLNPEPTLSRRIDVVLTTVLPIDVGANVVGVDPDGRTPTGLWPSDHAGVVAALRIRP